MKTYDAGTPALRRTIMSVEYKDQYGETRRRTADLDDVHDTLEDILKQQTRIADALERLAYGLTVEEP